MAVVCPTVTADEPHMYREQMERIVPFAHRIHIDLADGVFTPNKLIDLMQVWWPIGVKADIHLMYESVKPFLEQLKDQHPHMVIVHAESVGNFYEIARPLHDAGIKMGVALLQHTPVSKIKPAINDIDHVLIFSGNLGYQGGSKVDLRLLKKVDEIRKLKPEIEIGWDGGVKAENVSALVEGGIEVLNVGGAIHHVKDPEAAYNKLSTLAGATHA